MESRERGQARRHFLVAVAGAAAAETLGCNPSAAGGSAPTPKTVDDDALTKPPAPPTDTLPTRELGRTGQRVSLLGLGGFHIGQGSLDDNQAIAIIRRAIDNGLTFMDNCWDYNDGKSEERMGKALEGGYRQRAFLMTKLDGRTRDAARAQLGQSLARLRTDHIDLVQMHEVIRTEDPGRIFAQGGAIHALIEARREGKLRYIGFTGHKDPKIHLAMLETAKQHGFTFDTVQMPLNVMDAQYSSFEQAVLPVLLERGIGVLGMKSMGAGDILKSGVVTAPECLRYALSLPTSVVITGIDHEKLLDQALTAGRSFSPLTEAERKELLARASDAARDGKHELFKTSHKFDGTHDNPKWLEKAEL